MISEDLKISVIIPTYNRAHILPMAIESLLNQEFEKSDFEIIIVDNNSKDNTKEVVEKYIKGNPNFSIRYVFEPRQGLVYARHAGAKNAKFEILSFTDDDGILSSIWLKEINRVFEMDEQIVAVAGKITIHWDGKPPDWVIPYEPLLGKLDYGNEIRIEKKLSINGGNFSIKKDVLFKLGGFNPDQIGEWLIGDGEVGLVNKLHMADYLMGWAPDALMKHYQVVKKNATLKDIKRRYINNGRCVPYRIYAIEKRGIIGLVKNLFSALIKMIIWVIYFTISLITMDKTRAYRAIFEYAYNSCQFPYTLRIFADKKFRKELLKTDWIN